MESNFREHLGQPPAMSRDVFNSQNYWGWQGDLEIIQPNPLLKQENLEQVAQDHIQPGSEYLQRRLHWSSLDRLLQHSDTLKVKQLFLIFRQNFCVSVCVHCPLSPHWAPLKRVMEKCSKLSPIHSLFKEAKQPLLSSPLYQIFLMPKTKGVADTRSNNVMLSICNATLTTTEAIDKFSVGGGSIQGNKLVNI